MQEELRRVLIVYIRPLIDCKSLFQSKFRRGSRLLHCRLRTSRASRTSGGASGILSWGRRFFHTGFVGRSVERQGMLITGQGQHGVDEFWIDADDEGAKHR